MSKKMVVRERWEYVIELEMMEESRERYSLGREIIIALISNAIYTVVLYLISLL